MLLDDDERARLVWAETLGEDRDVGSPIPTRPISSDEFMPLGRSRRQREFAARVRAYGDDLADRQGLTRRRTRWRGSSASWRS